MNVYQSNKGVDGVDLKRKRKVWEHVKVNVWVMSRSSVGCDQVCEST